MASIPPAAAAAVTAPVRPITSGASRLIIHAGIGAAATIGAALWADNHYRDKPDATGHSPGRIDRREARELFSGADGFPAIVTFTALLAASFLYTRGREHLSPKEFNMLRTSYEILGGALVGTVLAPTMLRPLPEEYDPKPGAAVTDAKSATTTPAASPGS